MGQGDRREKERKTHFSWSLKTNLLSLRLWSTTFLRWASLTSKTLIIHTCSKSFLQFYLNKVENWVRGIGERKTHFSWSSKTNLLSLRFWSTTFLWWASLTSKPIIIYTSSKSFLQFSSLLGVRYARGGL